MPEDRSQGLAVAAAAAKVEREEEVASTSAGASDTDVSAPEPSSDVSAAAGASEAGSSSSRGDADAEEEGEEEEAAPARPNFAGTWSLERTEGDLDKFLTDMGQGWFIRNGAKALKYGVGRVVVECQQDGDDLKFSKVLADPRNLSKSHVHVVVGQGVVHFLDDIGRLASTSRWWPPSAGPPSSSSAAGGGEEGRPGGLRFDARLEASGLGVTLLMYFNDAGNFVEEMISCKGTVAKYIFTRKA